MPGVPVVFAGTELAIEGANDPGCRSSYPTQLNAEQKAAFEFAAPWIKLRGSNKALTHGGLEVHELKNHAILFDRRFDGQAIEVLVNTGYRDELLNSTISGEWLDRHQQSVTLASTVPQRSLFYRVIG